MASLLRFNTKAGQAIHSTGAIRPFATRITENPEDYTAEAQYPESINPYQRGIHRRKVKAYHEEYKKVGTVEEKLFKQNLPKYYGFKALILQPADIPYNCLNFIQYATCTELKEGLPESYKSEALSKYAEALKSNIEDIIGFEHVEQAAQNKNNNSPLEREKYMAPNIVEQLNRLIINALSKDFPHLNDVEVDKDPRHEAFWHLGGINPLRCHRELEHRKKKEDFAKLPTNRYVQYLGSPYLTLRHALPLKPLVDVDLETQNAKEEGVTIPMHNLDPRTLGYHTDHRRATTVPGFWPGSVQEFGLLSYQGREDFVSRQGRYNGEDHQEALHVSAIQASFAWLLGQACYQGFSTFNELTYPLTTQTIVTNGRLFSFYAYQMNTLLRHGIYSTANRRYNQCWTTPETALYEEVDDSGKVIGFNDDVLKTLISFYMNVPAEREYDMKPYLDKESPRISEIKDPERRQWLEEHYKKIASNRPIHTKIPEIYLWERIYKIQFSTRGLQSKRLRPFEKGINPFRRHLDDHKPRYIPRILRPGGYGGRRYGKSKEKWEKTYYPLGAKGKTPSVPNYPFVPYIN